MKFKANKRFKRDYDRIFKKDPEAANLFLLLCELADKNGRVLIDEVELVRLMEARFKNARERQL